MISPSESEKDYPEKEKDNSDKSLRYTVLRNKDFSGEKNLMAWSLAGSDLRGAILPDGFHFDLIDRVKDSAKNLNGVLLIFFAASLSFWLVRISYTDAQILLSYADASLPIIDVKIGLDHFFFLSPFILLTIYVYLHIGLQQLIGSAVNLPLFFPDGLRIDKKLYPSPIIRITKLIFPHHRNNEEDGAFLKLASFLRNRFTFIIIGVIIHGSLLSNWINYLPQHDLAVSLSHVGTILLGIALEWYFIRGYFKILIDSREEKKDKKGDSANSSDSIGDFNNDLEKLKRRKKRYYYGFLCVLIGTMLISTAYTIAVIKYQVHWPNRVTVLNLRNADLQSKDLSNRDLDGANLQGAKLSGCNITSTSFDKANLLDCKTDGAYIIIKDDEKCDDLNFDGHRYICKSKE